MSDNISPSGDLIEVELEEVGASQDQQPYTGPAYAPEAPPAASSTSINPVTYVPSAVVKKEPRSAITEKTIVFDVETTGTNPWDYRLIVATFWDLDEPVSEMITFAELEDEEGLTIAIADYINAKKPAIMVCYNNGFDQRALLSRFMLYQTPVVGWNKIKQIDVMDILKKGTTQPIYSSQPAGAEEQWLEFFFGEKKPYTIEECFAGLREGRLDEMIIRNRSCTESEGLIYKLWLQTTEEQPQDAETPYPTVFMRDEAAETGVGIVNCPVCEADNMAHIGESGGQCWRCHADLPTATPKNILKEVVRSYDFSKVGLTEKKPAAKSAKKK